MLRSDVVVAKAARFFLSVRYDPLGPWAESLPHASLPVRPAGAKPGDQALAQGVALMGRLLGHPQPFADLRPGQPGTTRFPADLPHQLVAHPGEMQAALHRGASP